ncbi:MAG: hypothetical protein HN337_08905, partial [Deltaproteobacteria bacterium]|nr:hypothetical protein [Deltaproteobacteria bacterium]
MKTLSAFMLVFMIVLLSACGGSSDSSGESAEEIIEDDDWRCITNSGEIFAGIAVDEGTGTLTVLNNTSAELAIPSLSIFDSSAGEFTSVDVTDATAVAANDSMTGTFSFPSGVAPEDTELIMLYFGDDQAAVFVTSTTYDSYSPAIIYPNAIAPETSISIKPFPYYVDPISGEWDFTMDMSTSYLTGTNCPSASASMTTSGDANLFVSNSGYSAVWYPDGNAIPLNRSAIDDTFESASYSFPVETEDESIIFGTNSWELTPTSASEIGGTLEWDNNQGCTASYPITMTHQVYSALTAIALCEGQWSIDYDTINCGGNTISPAELSNIPWPTGELDVTYDPSGDPMFLEYDTLFGYQNLLNNSGTNTYGSSLPSMGLGSVTMTIPIPPYSASIGIVGGFQMTAIDANTIYGTVVINGFGIVPCA